MTVSKPLTIIAGLGPGLGLSLARKFIEQGYEVVGLCRSPIAETKDLHTLTLDMADETQVKAAFRQIDEQFQRAPAVVIHNPAELIINPFLDHSSEDFEKTWRSMVLSAVLLSAECIPRMLSHDGGCMIFSGATAGIRAGAGFSAFASAKFALRGLTQSLAREFHPQGIHITHVILDGLIWSQRTQERFSPEQEKCMLPEDIAEVYWHITQQPRSTWSQEIDLRPDVESF
jgi:NAD(P)-dependent dehydrogenase (short-subunit alcohol dehydrogenase family)